MKKRPASPIPNRFRICIDLSGAEAGALEMFRIQRGARSWGATIRGLITDAIERDLADTPQKDRASV